MSNTIDKTSRPLVSVIIPTSNRAQLLARALESVISQTYDSLEIIVVDDASVDDTAGTIGKYREAFRSFKYIKNENQLGGAGSRNVGIENATGEYIAFLDDDDEWLPEKTARQLAVLEADLTIGAMTCWYFNISGAEKKMVQLVPHISFDTLLWENFAGSFSSCMVRSSIAKSISLDPGLKTGQDWLFWIMIAMTSKIEISEDYLINYHSHAGLRISNTKHYIFSTQRKVYFRFKRRMTADCRAYCLINILRYRILRSRRNILHKFLRIMRENIFLKTDTGRFILKRAFVVLLDQKLNLFHYNPDMATYSFIKQGSHGELKQ